MRKYSSFLLYLGLSLAILLSVQTNLINDYIQIILMFIGINIILCSSLNIINGYMGEFSCGHAGFMAVGAYVTSILNMWLFAKDAVFGLPFFEPSFSVFLFPVTLIIGGLAAAIVGLLVAIPSFKTRGDYLAIITLAVTYIIKSVIENFQTIGGARGFMGMRKVVDAMRNVADVPWILIWVLIFTALTIWIIYRFVKSTYGKGMVAIKDDEIAAEIMGVDSKRIKLTAFMLSSGLAGIAGGLFAHVLGYINPGSFTIMKSTEVLVMIYLGGMGSLSGSILSAIGFTVLMELLRPLQVLKWVLVPLLLIVIMYFRPEGIMGNRELTDIFPKLRKFFPAAKKIGR